MYLLHDIKYLLMPGRFFGRKMSHNFPYYVARRISLNGAFSLQFVKLVLQKCSL